MVKKGNPSLKLLATFTFSFERVRKNYGVLCAIDFIIEANTRGAGGGVYQNIAKLHNIKKRKTILWNVFQETKKKYSN